VRFKKASKSRFSLSLPLLSPFPAAVNEERERTKTTFSYPLPY
jgi:hypothetical protein